jgi:hypothetical protein
VVGCLRFDVFAPAALASKCPVPRFFWFGSKNTGMGNQTHALQYQAWRSQPLGCGYGGEGISPNVLFNKSI